MAECGWFVPLSAAMVIGVASTSCSAEALAAIGETTLTPFPNGPVAGNSFTIRIVGWIGTTPSPASIPVRVDVQGARISIEGCVPSGPGFAVPGSYTAYATISPLAAATYTVEYYHSYWCNPDPAYRAISRRFVTSSALDVIGTVPTLGVTSTAALSLLAALTGAYAYRRSAR
jgi:hypothetical protein